MLLSKHLRSRSAVDEIVGAFGYSRDCQNAVAFRLFLFLLLRFCFDIEGNFVLFAQETEHENVFILSCWMD